MSKREHKVHVPGEQSGAPSEAEAAEQSNPSAEAPNVQTSALAGAAPPDAELPASLVSKSDGNVLTGAGSTGAAPRVSKSDAIDPAVLNATSEAPAPKVAGGLPDQRDIDPEEIPFGGRVLTKQGYVCSSREPLQQPRR